MAVTRTGKVINIGATNDSVLGKFRITGMWAANAAVLRAGAVDGVIFWQPTAVGQRIEFPQGLEVENIYRTAGTNANLFIYLA